MRVLLFTRTLDVGGAERQLVLLAKSFHKRGISVAVMTYYGNGPFRAELDNSGVPVIDLMKTGRWDLLRFSFRTINAIRNHQPDVIYTFIGAHLVVSALWILIGRPAVVWGVRASNVDLTHYDWLSRFSDRCSIVMSRFADVIVCNSEAGREHILSQGYKAPGITVIPNGIDTNYFIPNSSTRLARRQVWNVPPNKLVVGMMARIDLMKDHANFLMAAQLVSFRALNIYFVCIGSGNTTLQAALHHQSEKLGLNEVLHWAGHSNNPVADYDGFDILVSSSITEAFPNVITEAMACGLPIVATDVGDCRQIVGNCGWIVPPKDPQALAQAILEAIDALPNWPHERSRQRVVENFSVDAMVDRTLAVLQSVVKS